MEIKRSKADIESVELYFHRFGSGPPVVILHGLFGSSRNWQSVARDLANKFSVITVDLRNHGSSPHVTKMTYRAMALDVSLLLQNLDLRDITLIGHSMGGKTAMTLALAEPDRISQLVIVDIGPGAYNNNYNNLIRALSDLDLSMINRRRDAHTQLKQAIPEHKIRTFLLQNLIFNAGSTPHWRINLPVIRDSIGEIVSAIISDKTEPFDRPAYFLQGEHSNRISDDHLSAISELFPQWELITIAASDHLPHIENPTDFLSKLHQLLD